MKTTIKKISNPIPDSNAWEDEWYIYLNGVAIAMAWRKENTKLIAKVLRKYKKKKKE